MTEDKQRRLQEALAGLEGYKRLMSDYGQQIQAVSASITEINATKKALEEISAAKPGSEILVPLGSESFARATLADNTIVLAGVGAGVTVEKKIADATKSLDAREKSLKEAAEKLGKNAAQLEAEMVKLDEQARKLMAESQK